MKHLTPDQTEWVAFLVDEELSQEFTKYVDDVIGYLLLAQEYPPPHVKPSKIREAIDAGRVVKDARFMTTHYITSIDAEKLIENWQSSKVPIINQELRNAICIFVDVYGVQPSKTIHGDQPLNLSGINCRTSHANSRSMRH